jgi:hypothetical protein
MDDNLNSYLHRAELFLKMWRKMWIEKMNTKRSFLISILHRKLLGLTIQGHTTRLEEMRNLYKILVRNPGRPRHEREDHTKGSYIDRR